MNQVYIKTITLLIAVLSLSACSSVHKTGENEPTKVSQESKRLAVDSNATYVTELSFDEKSANLDSSSRKKLDEIISQAKSTGKIDDIKVISWSDAEYPSAKNPKLSKNQNNLAERRANNIKSYLKGNDSSLDIDTFNMAARPSSISNLFNTENSKIKNSLEAAGISHDHNNHEYPNKAGKSTVMVILKE